jgi:TPR repeat protein
MHVQVESQFVIASCYEDGILGVKPDQTKALQFFTLAANGVP